ncbi:efflux RND transporter periplasmic adaptor subunit [Catenovulum adriaticum]|uniref:Efflux RND transporter periplasmic adaptor subunit n=1 Tax=Catenovulum adriaticum TaxID=2984846 RepID=A0ABY7AQK4_9ALTE|nr:efflux RND transporter periplasmic adaptor subunit [Catenovulum sp. TS8]WAJ71543.1 efflux RND transporter periplasmic adaptor subunit [Catenovulum sp. TS8]
MNLINRFNPFLSATRFAQLNLAVLSLGMLAMLSAFSTNASDGHSTENEPHHDQVIIDDKIAEQAGIQTQTVKPGPIGQTITAYGEIVYHPTQVSHVRARFNGVINNVTVDIGDEVKAGQILANIESNESLKPYPLKSPISGIVTDRHANAGELSLQQVLFTIANEKIRWVELKIFPSQQSKVTAGQTVWVHVPTSPSTPNQSLAKPSSQLNTTRLKAKIMHIVPSPQAKPYLIAHLKLVNSETNFHPGLMVTADIVVSQKSANMRVNNHAIQMHEGHKVVFIKKEQAYIARKISIGQQDNLYTEINSGLTAGDVYVSQNSYLIKADLAKSSASHSH